MSGPARCSARSGQAAVAGHDVLRHPGRVRREIGVVAQRSALDPLATGRDNLELQGRLFGVRAKALERRVTELLERFDLTGAADATYAAVPAALAAPESAGIGVATVTVARPSLDDVHLRHAGRKFAA
jgi:ABC-type Na+ transport system ATPase subunit NatA